MEILAKRLKWLRNKERYSQKEMADKIGMTPSGYQKLELSQRDPKLDVLIKLCDIFDVSADFLLGRDNQLTVLDKYKNNIEHVNLRITQMKKEISMTEEQVSILRFKLLEEAKELGFNNEQTLERSHSLDVRLSVLQSLLAELKHLQNKERHFVFDYIKIFLDIPFASSEGDEVIEKYRPYSSYIQMDIFDENQIHLHGNDIGSLGHLVGYKTIEEAEQAQEEILRRLNGR